MFDYVVYVDYGGFVCFVDFGVLQVVGGGFVKFCVGFMQFFVDFCLLCGGIGQYGDQIFMFVGQVFMFGFQFDFFKLVQCVQVYVQDCFDLYIGQFEFGDYYCFGIVFIVDDFDYVVKVQEGDYIVFQYFKLGGDFVQLVVVVLYQYVVVVVQKCVQ